MNPRARLTTASAGSVGSWLHFAAGTSLLIVVLAAMDFLNVSGRTSVGGQTVRSLVFALELAGAASVAGMLLWGVMWALRGKYAVHDFRDSVLWSACVISGLVMIARVAR